MGGGGGGRDECVCVYACVGGGECMYMCVWEVSVCVYVACVLRVCVWGRGVSVCVCVCVCGGGGWGRVCMCVCLGGGGGVCVHVNLRYKP